MKYLLILFIFLSPVYVHSQHAYYFSKGTKEGKGTKLQPFTSLQRLSQLSLHPGDTVFFHARDKLKGNIILDNIHGTKDKNIVFASYGKGKSIIDGGSNEAFAINESGYFQILNIELKGSGRKTGNTKDGMRVVNCKNAAFKNIEVSGFQKAGLQLYNCAYVEVNSVFAHDNGAAGILVEGDYQKRISDRIRIVNCRSENNPGDPTRLDNHSGNGIVVGNCKNVLIEYCTATNNGWDMPRIGNGPVGIWAYEADSVTIQHCISYRNKTAKGAADGGGFDLDGGVTNSVIQYCLSYENWGSGYGIFQYYSAGRWYNNTVRYCISINDGQATTDASAMLIWNGWNGDSTFTDFKAYNNFFYNDRKYAFGFSSESNHRRFYFFNNVFVASDTSDIFNGIDSSTTDLFFGNVWMKKSGGFTQNGYSNFEEWTKAEDYEQNNGKITGQSFQQKIFSIPSPINITDPHKLKTSPLLFSICSSLLYKKGIDLQKMFSIDKGKKDFFGNTIPAHDLSIGVCTMK